MTDRTALDQWLNNSAVRLRNEVDPPADGDSDD